MKKSAVKTCFANILQSIKECPYIIVTFLSPFLFGVFFDYTSCIFSIILSIFVIILFFKKKQINLDFGLSSIAILSIVFFYLISIIWVNDRGMQFVGFLKFLPLLFILFITLQCTESDKQKILASIPYSAALMTVISFALKFIPSMTKYFTVADRLAGFFQYSNTFALFLLLGLIVIATSEKIKLTDFILIGILLFGILESGSRAVFALTILTIILILLFNKNKKVKRVFFIVMIVGIALGTVIAFVTDNFQTIGRFLTTSLKSSSALGRVLYYKDAIPVILKHPFGMGYMEYYYEQGSFQTGVYSVMYVHNDFLQLFLDIGWIPAGLLIAAIIRTFFKKGTNLRIRMMLLMISAHGMFDFNLQFVYMYVILILILDYDKLNPIILSSAIRKSVATVCVLLIALNGYFGTVFALSHKGLNDIAVKMFPKYTNAYITIMNGESNVNIAKGYADKVTALNKNIASAYDIYALYYYQQGDFGKVITYKKRAISLAP